jgi:hypothetical protein
MKKKEHMSEECSEPNVVALLNPVAVVFMELTAGPKLPPYLGD